MVTSVVEMMKKREDEEEEGEIVEETAASGVLFYSFPKESELIDKPGETRTSSNLPSWLQGKAPKQSSLCTSLPSSPPPPPPPPVPSPSGSGKPKSPAWLSGSLVKTRERQQDSYTEPRKKRKYWTSRWSSNRSQSSSSPPPPPPTENPSPPFDSPSPTLSANSRSSGKRSTHRDRNSLASMEVCESVNYFMLPDREVSLSIQEELAENDSAKVYEKERVSPQCYQKDMSSVTSQYNHESDKESASWCENHIQTIVSAIKSSDNSIPELHSWLDELSIEKRFYFIKDLQSKQEQRILSMEREYKAALELNLAEEEVERKEFESHVLKLRLERLDRNISFIESEWKRTASTVS